MAASICLSGPNLPSPPNALGGNKMSDLGSVAQVNSMNFVMKQTVRVGDSLVLTQMFQPRIDDERFQQVTLFCRVLEDAPIIGTVAPPLLTQSFKRNQKGVSVGEQGVPWGTWAEPEPGRAQGGQRPSPAPMTRWTTPPAKSASSDGARALSYTHGRTSVQGVTSDSAIPLHASPCSISIPTSATHLPIVEPHASHVKTVVRSHSFAAGLYLFP